MSTTNVFTLSRAANTGAVDPLMEKFNASLPYDKKLWRHDIIGSQAYARAINRAGIITSEECSSLVKGLSLVEEEWKNNSFEIKASDEDIHTANERRLTELIGPVAGKLHTGRSRNDQVATDVRLWLKDEIKMLQHQLQTLIITAVAKAEAEINVLMPGFTHLQPAQPIRWSHWILKHVACWQRDAERLKEIYARVDKMPLGSGALAGHSFGLDREALARDLNFMGGPTMNSLDAVSDRDFIVEFLFWGSLHLVHLSSFSEDLIIYCSGEYKYVKLSDAYTTGSSLMPQKKNPDALELLRGKSGRTIGQLTGLLVTLKGLPSTYNKDLQEDKEPLFDAVVTLSGAIPIATGVLATMTPNVHRLRQGLSDDMLATDLADYLVRRGVPFRETHHIAGKAVRLAEEKNVSLSKLSLEDIKSLHPKFEDDVLNVWNFDMSVERRNSTGGTSRRSVTEQIEKISCQQSFPLFHSALCKGIGYTTRP